jgi:hypothetical protein
MYLSYACNVIQLRALFITCDKNFFPVHNHVIVNYMQLMIIICIYKWKYNAENSPTMIIATVLYYTYIVPRIFFVHNVL